MKLKPQYRNFEYKSFDEENSNGRFGFSVREPRKRV